MKKVISRLSKKELKQLGYSNIISDIEVDPIDIYSILTKDDNTIVTTSNSYIFLPYKDIYNNRLGFLYRFFFKNFYLKNYAKVHRLSTVFDYIIKPVLNIDEENMVYFRRIFLDTREFTKDNYTNDNLYKKYIKNIEKLHISQQNNKMLAYFVEFTNGERTEIIITKKEVGTQSIIEKDGFWIQLKDLKYLLSKRFTVSNIKKVINGYHFIDEINYKTEMNFLKIIPVSNTSISVSIGGFKFFKNSLFRDDTFLDLSEVENDME